MTEPKRIGRPPTSDPWVKLTINLKASELAAIDAMRGEATRPEYVRAVVNGINVPREPTPAQMAPVRAATERKIQDAIDVQIGPRREAPGARLKGLKRKDAQ